MLSGIEWNKIEPHWGWMDLIYQKMFRRMLGNGRVFDGTNAEQAEHTNES